MDGALVVDDDDDEPQAKRSPAEPAEEDGKAELAAEMVSEIVTRMGLKVAIEIRENGEEVVLDLAGEDAGRVIGKKGQTLDALQFVINKIVNRFPEGRRHILLDS